MTGLVGPTVLSTDKAVRLATKVRIHVESMEVIVSANVLLHKKEPAVRTPSKYHSLSVSQLIN